MNLDTMKLLKVCLYHYKNWTIGDHELIKIVYLAVLSSLADYDVILPNIPIVLDDVECIGHETSLLNCPHNDFTVHSCVHDEDIVLECRGLCI